MNRDGKIDLLVAASHDGSNDLFYIDGFVYVMTGNGDGTFAQPIKYETAAGAWRIVTGDFNRDGIVDIATANRSANFVNDCGGQSFRTWDSVTILPGSGGGTFGVGTSSFSLGNQLDLVDKRFRNTVRSLVVADVNRDGGDDLVASEGAILITTPPNPNWPPSVDAGPDQVQGGAWIMLAATASDDDQDMLTYRWTASNGMSVPPVPNPCVDVVYSGTYTFTVTVDDGHGHQTSDSVTYTIPGSSDFEPLTFTAPAGGEIVTAGVPYTIRWTSTGHGDFEELIFHYTTDGGATSQLLYDCLYVQVGAHQCTWKNPGPATEHAMIWASTRDADVPASGSTREFLIHPESASAVPWPWQHADVGAVAARGSASYSDGVFTVSGNGADIWGTADELQYVYQYSISGTMGDLDLVTRVDSVQNVNAWTKAGLMVRSNLNPSSPQASIFVTPGKGIAFQRRTSAGGTSVNTSGPLWTAPVWLRLSLRGKVVVAYYKKSEGDGWIRLGDDTVVAGYAGLAVSSHVDGTIATGAFSNVSITPWEPTFTTALIGSTIGSATVDGGSRYTITNRGADIWGTADQLTLVSSSWYGDGKLGADVRSIENTSAWAKAGVTFRAGTAAGAPHVSLYVTPGKGIAMQYRSTAGGVSAQVAQVAGVTPVVLMLTRTGNTFTGAWTIDRTNWHTVGTITVTMDRDVLAGLAVTSHNTSATTTATIANPWIYHP